MYHDNVRGADGDGEGMSDEENDERGGKGEVRWRKGRVDTRR